MEWHSRWATLDIESSLVGIAPTSRTWKENDEDDEEEEIKEGGEEDEDE